VSKRSIRRRLSAFLEFIFTDWTDDVNPDNIVGYTISTLWLAFIVLPPNN